MHFILTPVFNSQITLKFLDRITAFKGIMIHPDIVCLLHLLRIFNYREFQYQALESQFLILTL